MIFINNSSHISVGIRQQHEAGNTPPETTSLVIHIGTCLNMLPPKQLGRCLRDAFLLHLEELQKTCPDFYGFVVEFGVLLARLDAEEERQAIAKING